VREIFFSSGYRVPVSLRKGGVPEAECAVVVVVVSSGGGSPYVARCGGRNHCFLETEERGKYRNSPARCKGDGPDTLTKRK